MADLFWAYWDATIRFALLALLLLLATPILRRWLTPRVLCWAWAILLLRLAFPFAMPFSGSVFNLHDGLQPSAWTEIIRKGVVDSGFGETILPRFRDQDDLVLATRIDVSWETVLWSIWIVGVAGMSIHLLVNALRLRRFLRKSVKHTKGELYDLFKETRQRYGIHANVPLLVSNDVKTPGIGGILNPRIIIPRVCVEKLSREEMKCVFLHELTHYRRGDLFLHHFLLLVCYLHWYNPLVWLVLRQFKITMEQACDQEVVDSVCVDTVKEYGLTLLQVLRQSRVNGPCPAGALCLLGNRKNGALRERIKLISQNRQRNPVLASVGLMAFAACFLYSMTGEEAEPTNESLRYFKLTGFSTPFEAGENENLIDWVDEVELSKYKGKRIRIKAHIETSSSNVNVEFRAYAKGGDKRILDFESSLGRPKLMHAQWSEAEVEMWIPKSAEEFNYGLTVDGPGRAWIKGIEIEILNEESEKVDEFGSALLAAGL